MAQPIDNLTALLRNLSPNLHPETYVFCLLPSDHPIPFDSFLGLFRESEGISLVIEESIAKQNGLEPKFRAKWITLQVYSDLHAIGLTAAVSRALAEASISCNIVAGTLHDHLFVPVDRAEEALSILQNLSRTH